MPREILSVLLPIKYTGETGPNSMLPFNPEEPNPMQALSINALARDTYFQRIPLHKQQLVIQTLSVLANFVAFEFSGKPKQDRELWIEKWDELNTTAASIIDPIKNRKVDCEAVLQRGFKNLYQGFKTGEYKVGASQTPNRLTSTVADVRLPARANKSKLEQMESGEVIR